MIIGLCFLRCLPLSLQFLVCVCLVSHVQLFANLWTVAHRAPLSMGCPRPEYWSGLPFPPPGDLPYLEIKPVSSALAGRFLTTEPPGNPLQFHTFLKLRFSLLFLDSDFVGWKRNTLTVLGFSKGINKFSICKPMVYGKLNVSKSFSLGPRLNS